MILVKQRIIPTTDHDFEETFVNPTTNSDGYTLCKCTVCRHEEKKNFVPAVNSNGFEIEVDTTNKTCVITGIGTCEDTDINIPEKISEYTVVGIADKAFSEQTQITSVTIPKTVKNLGQRAFYGCTGLTEFTIPASVTSVGHQIFYKCDNLTTVYYNSSFSPATDKVFLNIPSVKTVIFGGTTVPNSICYNCTNIEKVEILDNVRRIGGYSFYCCSGLKEIHVGKNVMSIGNSAFYVNRKSLKNVYVSGLETWMNIDLYDSSSNPLYGSGNLYFSGVLVTSIIIPDNFFSIGDYTFVYCSSLESIEIPDSVTSIGKYAFSDCNSLKNLYISDLESWLNVKLTTSGSHPLYLAGGNLYIDGVLATDIEIPDTFSSIGNYAFFNCDSIKSVKIPDSVTSIGSSVFWGCSSLASIEIPDSITSIGPAAFSSCSSLVSIEIPDSVTSIGDGVFKNCSSMVSIVMYSSISFINDFAFLGCNSLSFVYYVGNVDDWRNIGISYENEPLLNATRYYYSAIAPTTSGNYWHYVDGKPTPW